VSALIRITWLIWILAIIFLAITITNYESSILTLLFVLIILTGIVLYNQELNKKRMKRIRHVLESIDMTTLEDGVKNMNRRQSECYSRIFSLENDLQKYKSEEENKYRDVVRKVLDVDNKFTRKCNLLGETIIEVSKKKKGD
jgi:uncharacterized membrane protein YhiD involved in acid resistance